LEREAGVPGEMIVEAHGSFATQRCIECKTDFPNDLMKKAIQAREVPHCIIKTCNGLVKPDIVFFGEALPEEFHRNRTLPASADLAIVMGTSLTVQPFASLPSFVPEQTPRILLNLERVGGLGSRADDVLLLGDCDEGVRKLAKALGWLEELEELWQQTNPAKKDQEEQQLTPKTRDEKLENEVEQLTKDIEKTLKISQDHNVWLKNDLGESHELEQTASAPLENTLSVTSTTSNPAAKQGLEEEKAATNAGADGEELEPKVASNETDDKSGGEKAATNAGADREELESKVASNETDDKSGGEKTASASASNEGSASLPEDAKPATPVEHEEEAKKPSEKDEGGWIHVTPHENKRAEKPSL
jgi:NAD+-dependent protein deacetylase SIR2